jgi:hypothetical protein
MGRHGEGAPSDENAEQHVRAEIERYGLSFDTEIWEKWKEALKLQ